MFAKAKIVGWGAVVLAGLSGCTPYSNSLKEESAVDDRLATSLRESTKVERLSQVRDLGAGIFVFPRQSTFPETLADFAKSHPELRIVSVSQSADMTTGVLDNTDSRANSMVVVTEKR